MSGENVVSIDGALVRDAINSDIDRSELPDYQVEMLDIIDHVDEYAWERGELGGLDFGFPQLTRAVNGLQPAMYLIAGPPNVGKSAYALQLAWQVAHNNEDAYVIYWALDDRKEDILPRVVSMDQRVPINVIKIPERYVGQENLMQRRTQGLNRLRGSVDKFKLLDQGEGQTIEKLEEIIQRHKMHLEMNDPDKKLVVFVDNFYDLMSESQTFNGDNQKYEYIATKMDDMIEQYDVPIVSTAELRKLNGNRRPTPDDLRSTIKLQYMAKVIMLCYNEVGFRGEAANVFWQKHNVEEKQPVLEVRLGKNKLGSFKGRLFYQFWADQSYLCEVPKEQARNMNARITV